MTAWNWFRVPVERLAERYSSGALTFTDLRTVRPAFVSGTLRQGIFQQWFNLDTKTDPRMPAGDLQSLVSRFEQACLEVSSNSWKKSKAMKLPLLLSLFFQGGCVGRLMPMPWRMCTSRGHSGFGVNLLVGTKL